MKTRKSLKDKPPLKKVTLCILVACGVSIPLVSNALSFSLGSLLSPTAIQAHTSLLSGAIAVNTRQVALASSQIVQNENDFSKMIVSGIQAVDQSFKLKEAILNSSTNAALPDSAFCSALEQRSQTELNESLKNFNLVNYMHEVAAKPYSSSFDEETAPYAMHFSTACSVEEAKMGVCPLIPNGLQYGDIDTSFVSSRLRLSEDQAAIALNYSSINSNRIAPASLVSCDDVNCKNFKNQYMQGNALASLSTYSTANNVMSRVTPNSQATASANFYEAQ